MVTMGASEHVLMDGVTEMLDPNDTLSDLGSLHPIRCSDSHSHCSTLFLRKPSLIAWIAPDCGMRLSAYGLETCETATLSRLPCNCATSAPQ